MQRPRFRVRTLMVAVGVVALLIWGAKMGARSYVYHRLAREYAEYERGWREIAARHREQAKFKFNMQCAEYYAMLARKYRGAMWRPWLPVAPDPFAPGVQEYLDQQRALQKSRAGSWTDSPR